MKTEIKRLEKAILKIGGPEKAVVILEAAGRVDKTKDKNIISGVNPYPVIRSFECAWSGDDYKGTCGFMKGCANVVRCQRFKKQIRALLESLPDGEGEKG